MVTMVTCWSLVLGRQEQKAPLEHMKSGHGMDHASLEDGGDIEAENDDGDDDGDVEVDASILFVEH